MGSLPGQVQRRIESVEFATRNIAIVHVVAESNEPATSLEEIFLVVEDAGEWTIRVHEAGLLPLRGR